MANRPQSGNVDPVSYIRGTRRWLRSIPSDWPIRGSIETCLLELEQLLQNIQVVQERGAPQTVIASFARDASLALETLYRIAYRVAGVANLKIEPIAIRDKLAQQARKVDQITAAAKHARITMAQLALSDADEMELERAAQGLSSVAQAAQDFQLGAGVADLPPAPSRLNGFILLGGLMALAIVAILAFVFLFLNKGPGQTPVTEPTPQSGTSLASPTASLLPTEPTPPMPDVGASETSTAQSVSATGTAQAETTAKAIPTATIPPTATTPPTNTPVPIATATSVPSVQDADLSDRLARGVIQQLPGAIKISSEVEVTANLDVKDQPDNNSQSLAKVVRGARFEVVSDVHSVQVTTADGLKQIENWWQVIGWDNAATPGWLPERYLYASTSDVSVTDYAEQGTYEVNAKDGWQDTGLYIQAGQAVLIEYLSGIWRPYPGASFDGRGCATPPGSCGSSAIVAYGWLGSLVAQIGVDEPILVGNIVNTIAVQGGPLRLRSNDTGVDDNSGSISVRVSLGKASAFTPGNASGRRETWVQVRANETQWQHSRITAAPGDILTIEYIRETWRPYPGVSFDGRGCGALVPPCNESRIITYGWLGALLARIGSGEPFVVGNGVTTTVRTDNGTVFLIMNDTGMGDNSGAITVRVAVSKQ